MTIYKFRFDYQKDPAYPNYKEYDGTIITAPDEKTAIIIFDGISGEFGLADSRKYNLEKIGAAYEFDGDIDEWHRAIELGEAE